MSNDLAQRLRRAAPEPTRVITVAQLADETRRHRQRQWVGAAAVSLLVIAGAFIGLLNAGGGGSDRETIAAVPSAAPPAGPTVSATPKSGLIDGQTIIVRGSGFTPNAQIAMVTCGVESSTLPNKQAACDVAAVQYAVSDVRGEISTSYVVQRTITSAETGTLDCGSAPARCRLGVGEVKTQEGASVLLSFSDEAAKTSKPTLAFANSHGPALNPLVREIAGSGFVANRSVAIRECLPNTDCSGNDVIRTVMTNGSGSFLASVTLNQKINAFAGDEAWCATKCLLSATVEPESSHITAVSPAFSLAGPAPDGDALCAVTALQQSYAVKATSAGAHSLQVTVKNKTQDPCWLNGYPSVQLENGDFPANGVGSFYSTSAGATTKLGAGGITDQPGWVRVAPQGVAHFLIVKNDCAAGSETIANVVEFALPGESTFLPLPIPKSDGALALPTCHSNVSNVVHVGPFVAGSG
jgi:hypothetical protein